jgi:cell division protein FtsB
MRRRQQPMTKLRRQRGFLRAIWMPIVTAAFLGYFGYHAFTGSLGIWSMDRLMDDTAQLSVQLADLTAQRQALEAKVARLRPDSLDADLVDQRAREALNVMRPDELILTPTAAR